MATRDQFASTLDTALGRKTIYELAAVGNVDHLPATIKILLESVLRNFDGTAFTEQHVKVLLAWQPKPAEAEIPFMPCRVVLQDFTGVPCVVDLAAMREAMKTLGGNPAKVNPLVPCDLVIDHSVQVDHFGSSDAEAQNSRIEFARNRERYEFLKWGQGAFANFRAVPPATGIVHQVNLEYLARVVWEKDGVLYPDTCVGTDSHTTMINGLGVLGWGVGGIEAEAVMLGQPTYMLIPEVVGFRMSGKLPAGATATDLVLRVTEMLRKHGVVDKFVEFHGSGLDHLTPATRATVANMAPEYGATCGYFPVDDATLEYLRLTGRDEKHVAAVEAYCKAQGLWRDPAREVEYSSELGLDLADVRPALAGPKRPQDRIDLDAMKSQWRRDISDTFGVKNAQNNLAIAEMANEGGKPAPARPAAAAPIEEQAAATITLGGKPYKLEHGHVVIAAITSCTNTSNPGVLVAAGLIAKKAVELGLQSKPWVKTSLAPGSQVVPAYLRKAGLMPALEKLGFNVVGFGCTTCIGNSGPLPEPVSTAIRGHNLVAASVLSGNRNFEGRVHPDVKANYLASPPLVVAYALAGTVDIDLTTEPLGIGTGSNPVYLRDLWPSEAEIEDVIRKNIGREQFLASYADVFAGSAEWKAVKTVASELYKWDAKSTYIQHPPYFEGMTRQPGRIAGIRGARCLLKLGDSVTTDHISPAGDIEEKTPAGQFLVQHGVSKADFNSYGSRRGNHEVMMRGTFANKRIRNQLAPGTEGGWTTDFTDAKVKYVYEASLNYRKAGTPLVVLAGKDYGMGSSRDWAAKGAMLLGVRAVIAESFERIHRANLVGMGVLSCTYEQGQTAASLGLTGQETFEIEVPENPQPLQKLKVKAGDKQFTVTCRLNTPVEVEYYRNGGILHTVLRKMA